jgi:hypothetical protein
MINFRETFSDYESFNESDYYMSSLPAGLTSALGRKTRGQATFPKRYTIKEPFTRRVAGRLPTRLPSQVHPALPSSM